MCLASAFNIQHIVLQICICTNHVRGGRFVNQNQHMYLICICIFDETMYECTENYEVNIYYYLLLIYLWIDSCWNLNPDNLLFEQYQFRTRFLADVKLFYISHLNLSLPIFALSIACSFPPKTFPMCQFTAHPTNKWEKPMSLVVVWRVTKLLRLRYCVGAFAV